MSVAAFSKEAATVSGVAKSRGAASTVAFDQVSVAYKGAVVLKPLTLEVAAGEILALIGPSGSGKTTALRAVAGFVKPAGGRIWIGGVDVTTMPPYMRGLAMVVQNYALFPHMRVFDNVAFGLHARGEAKALIEERVAHALNVVGMSKFVRRYPRELSGGQQQRIAIARALAVRPKVLLLDEPLSALDAQIRRSMVDEIARLHADLPELTILYVTHDQSEALTLADRIAIMKDGAVSAIGRTGELYRRPPNRFAAEFLGRANLLPVVVEQETDANGFASVRNGEERLVAQGSNEKSGSRALLCVRPQHLTLVADATTTNRVVGTVQETLWQGELTHLVADVGGVIVRVVATKMQSALTRGDRVEMFFAPSDSSLIPEDANA